MSTREAERLAPGARPDERASWWSTPATPVVVSVVLSLVGALTVPYSQDEYATLEFAGLRLGQLFDAVSHVDLVLAPYYLVAHLATMVSAGSLIGPRLISVVASALAVWWLGSWVLRRGGRGPALVAGLALAVNPLFVQQSYNARPYALATAALVLTATSLDRAVDRRGLGRQLLPGAAALVATVLQPLSVLVLPPIAVLALRRRSARAVLALAPGAVVGLLILVSARTQSDQVEWIEPVGVRRALGVLSNVVSYQRGTQLDLLALLTLAMFLGALLLALTALTSRQARGAVGRLFLVGALWLVFPWTALVVVSGVSRPLLTSHYVTFSTPAVGLLAGVAWWSAVNVWQPERRVRRAVGTVALLAFLLGSGVVTLRSTVTADDDFSDLARAVEQSAGDGDAVLVSQGYGQTGLAWGVATDLRSDEARQRELNVLVRGDRPVLERWTVTSVQPFEIGPGGGSALPRHVWVVSAGGGVPSDPTSRALLQGVGCGSPPAVSSVRRFDTLALRELSCEP